MKNLTITAPIIDPGTKSAILNALETRHPWAIEAKFEVGEQVTVSSTSRGIGPAKIDSMTTEARIAYKYSIRNR